MIYLSKVGMTSIPMWPLWVELHMYDKRQLQIGSKLKVEQVKKNGLSPDGMVDETIYSG